LEFTAGNFDWAWGKGRITKVCDVNRCEKDLARIQGKRLSFDQ